MPSELELSAEAVDAAYAKLTARAKTQRQVWTVEPAASSADCARRLTMISDAGAYVFQVNSLPEDALDIVWYRFE